MAERINAVKTSFFGKGAIRLLGPELQKMGIRRALLVTDRFLYDSGAAARVGQVLSDAGVEYAVYYNVQPNPTVQVVNDCIAAARTLQVQLLVALGGGSAIDTAKAASIVVACGGTVEQYEGENKSSKPGLPIVAVNTTAGTGSECTSFYIVTDPVRHSKMAMVDPNCMVSIAVNDTDFMSSMPPKLTAATGMDALTHAIEAYTGRVASPITDGMALHAIRLIAANLVAAVEEPGNADARQQMLVASLMAGAAFGNSDVASVHCISEAIGAMYDTPHGVANAIFLPFMFRHNCDTNPARHAQVAYALGIDPTLPEAEAAEAAADHLTELSRRLGIPRFRDVPGVDEADFQVIAEKSKINMSDGSNAKTMTVADYLDVIRKAYALGQGHSDVAAE